MNGSAAARLTLRNPLCAGRCALVRVRHKGKRQTQEKVGDDEEWHRFIGVAADGNEILEKCLPHLKTASHVWGRDKIHHYRWHHRGWSFCKKLGTVAKMMTWQDFVIKANRLLWRRATVDRKHRRLHMRGFPHLLGDNERNGGLVGTEAALELAEKAEPS
ncbi:hypothetical protein F5883DRAFT_585969 [Diaporthe sp. PMI_573]|nr:hypothetical protein F5883DRAFT_585969 [Diaporthaceae sp. PMI_573]